MRLLIILLNAIYIVCVVGLAAYGFQALWLTWRYLHGRPRSPRLGEPTAQGLAEWPALVVQLPIYNEQHVAERIIRACCRLDYPRDRLLIQVLDDSDDVTQTLIQRVVQQEQERGVPIELVRRPTRDGYKAGALAHALSLFGSSPGDQHTAALSADLTAEFIAIFDADFEPQPDFLVRTVPQLLASGNVDVGFVQARWGHLNRDASFLTRSQALALDGHFVVEQGGRQAAGYAFGFNGSAGVWRRACIEDPAVGGWQTDTLCEDLDLSYRAQLAGWRGLYLNQAVAPAEIPPQLLAYKRQQYRWAKGSIQTLRKLGGRVWSSRWPLTKRLAALFHLGSYLVHPLLLGLLLVTLPLAAAGAAPAPLLVLLSLASLGPPLLYAVGQRSLYPRQWPAHWAYLPLLMLLGTGMSLSNTLAVMHGLRGHDTEFLRTPKFQDAGAWRQSAYRLPLQSVVFAELALSLYALITVGVLAAAGKWWGVPFMLIYALGFGLVAGMGLWQASQAWLVNRRHKRGPVSEQSSIA